MKKRLLSMLLSAVMLTSTLPVSVLATEAAETEAVQQSTEVAEPAAVAELADAVAEVPPAELQTPAPYTTWQNATVVTPGQPTYFTLDTYSDSLTDSQVWLVVTVPEDNQAIRMDFASLPKNVDGMLYSEETLRQENPSYRNDLYRDTITNDSYSYKVEHAGIYYIMLRSINDSNTFTSLANVTVSIVDGDLNEDAEAGNNDVWSRATELTRNVNSYFNLNGCNDVDWFKVTTTVPGEAIKIVLSNFDYTVDDIGLTMYSSATLESGGSTWLLNKSGDSDCSYSYKANEPGDYYIELQPSYSDEFVTRALKIRYETVEGDGYELNDTWQTATPIPQDAFEMEFTLNGENDQDWFWFETTEVNEVVNFYVRGFETDYSNVISYTIYDIDENSGEKTRLLYTYGIDSNSSAPRTMQFETVGKHFVCIELGSYIPVENTLRFSIERRTIAIDGGEPNDSWQTATPIYADLPQTFNLPAATDVDWFKFTVNEPNQTVEFTLTIPAEGYGRIGLYSGEELNLFGDNASWLEGYYFGSGVNTERWMLSEPGDYYLKVNPYNSGYIFEADATVTYTLIEADGNERNDTWKTATALTEGVAAEFTLPASNDVDWFKLTTTEPDQTVEFTLTIPAEGYGRVGLYAGEDFIQSGDGASWLEGYYFSSGVNTERWMLGEPGDYYLKIYPYNSGYVFDEDATVTYTLVEPDDNERNNDWKTATALTEGVATAFTLPASNDVDWFKLTTVEPNQTVEFTLTIPAEGYGRVGLYAGEDFIQSGDGASWLEGYYFSSGVNTERWMLGEPGDYYLKIYPYNSGYVFDEDATVTYTLVEPDDNERNNDWDTATPLPVQTSISYTLPAPNDYDWFKLDAVTPGDRITFYYGDIPEKAFGEMRNHLYCKTEYDVEPVGVAWDYAGDQSWTYSVETEGDYYIYMNSWISLNSSMSLRYSIARDDVNISAVGISSINNAPTTIFQGKTLGLYPVITPANATNQNVTWISSNPEVATVNADGLVTAIAPGTTKITVTTEDGGYSATSTITVVAPIPVEGVTVTSNEVKHEGETEDNPKLLSQGTAIRLYYKTIPETATEQEVTWSVSDPEVLAVTDYGKVAAVGSGGAYVTVTTADGGFVAKYYVNVPDETAPVKRITLNANALTLYMEEEATRITANIYPSYATNPLLRWSSDNPAVATVDELGNVTPVGEGYATITAAAQENESITATCSVCVQPKRTRVSSISFDTELVELGLYGVTSLSPIVGPEDATDKTVTWSTNNKNIVSVSRNGVITGLNLGTAIITATTTDGQLTASVTVQVSSNAPLGDVSNDGIVDAADALLILRSSVRLLALSDVQKAVADLNGDGEIDAGDAVLILRYDAGLIDEFPAQKQ